MPYKEVAFYPPKSSNLRKRRRHVNVNGRKSRRQTHDVFDELEKRSRCIAPRSAGEASEPPPTRT
ncbi:hypothetical protein EYF80_040059 [Liparis tanakae]|uniref:Uncharacterized protein n=1 Tax=Liparis tanakae TaxID=230148 RepID=A0A4Z2G881_9TELE|nr:hypothetical protein EYF80_040059 [Liparis tanakae]